MPIVGVAGNDLFYTVSRRAGPAAVLIHGAGGSRLLWPAALRRLSGHTVYALDLPGHGRSTGAARERIEGYAADLLGFLDAMRLHQAVLIGHSMGGAIAMATALAAGERVTGLVLAGTAARLRVAPAVLEGLAGDFESTARLIAEWAWGSGADPAIVARGSSEMRQAGPQVLLSDFRACDRFDVRDRVPEIAAPALVISGSDDRLVPARFGQWLAEQLPRARFLLFEGAGHMVVMERPLETARAIQQWSGSERIPV